MHNGKARKTFVNARQKVKARESFFRMPFSAVVIVFRVGLELKNNKSGAGCEMETNSQTPLIFQFDLMKKRLPKEERNSLKIFEAFFPLLPLFAFNENKTTFKVFHL